MNAFIKYDYRVKTRMLCFLLLFVALLVLLPPLHFGKIYSQISLFIVMFSLSVMQLYYIWFFLYEFNLNGNKLVAKHIFINDKTIDVDELIDIRLFKIEKYNVFQFFTKNNHISIISTNNQMLELIKTIISMKLQELKEKRFNEFDNTGINVKQNNRSIRNVLFLDLFSIVFGASLFLSFPLLDMMNILGILLICISVLFSFLHIYMCLIRKECVFIDKNGITINSEHLSWMNITNLEKCNSMLWGNRIKIKLINGEEKTISGSFLYSDFILEDYLISKLGERKTSNNRFERTLPLS